MSWWRPGRRPEPVIDPGLQAERTMMAWQRTSLGVGAIGALLLHHTGGRTLLAIPGAAGLLAALVLLVATEHRYVRTVRRVTAGEPASSQTLIRVVSGITVLLALAALVIVVPGSG